MLIWAIITWLIITGLVLFHPSYTASHLFVTGLNPFVPFIFWGAAALLIIPPILFLRRTIVKRPAFKDLRPGDWFVIGAISWLAALPLVYDQARLNIYFYDVPLFLPCGIIWGAIVLYFGLCGLLYFRLPANNPVAQVHFWITLLGFIVVLFPIHYETYLTNEGHRYIDHSNWYPEQNTFLNTWIITVLSAQVLCIFNIMLSRPRVALLPASHSYPRKPPLDS